MPVRALMPPATSAAPAGYRPPRIPRAQHLPMGAVVLSATGPQREDLVGSLLFGGALVFLLGYGVGAKWKWPKQR